MKELDKKQAPAVSGGEYAPSPYDSGEVLPLPPTPLPTYPQNPIYDPAPGRHMER
ncbi:MAG TPA: hypothetical protein VEG27_14350 [Usitatibacter sp.]|nr:hypothetical protein [Usitatibacter sp.]